jgi:hypothetical protein
VPVCKDDPPVGSLYQFITPALGVASKATVPASHLDNGLVPVIVGEAFTVATTAILDDEVQPLFVAST